MIRHTLAMAVSFAALVSANAALAQTAPLLDVTLKPGAADAQGHVAFVDIVAKIPAADTPAGAPLLALPVVVANVEGVAKTIRDSFHYDGGSNAVYAAMVESLDRGVGQLLAALAANGQAEDTIVICSGE